ncbi:MAG: glycerophosphodiester phosphodiesterase, partial [Bacteroidales bacterium]
MKRIKKLLILLASAMLCYSCTSDTEYNITNIHNDIIVMGHGGMGFFHHYPLNTFESIMNCINLGAEGTEIDVQISRDNVLYAFHNRDLKDDTNLEGLIREKTSEELDACFYNNQA